MRRGSPVTAKQSPLDQRPFRSRAEHDRQDSLESKYRNVAIPGLVAALRQLAPPDKGEAV